MGRIFIERSIGHEALNHSKGARFFPGCAHSFIDRTDRPCQTVDTKTWRIAIDHEAADTPPKENPMKPPYRVPSMEEIRALPWNGFTCVSTFSGGGGSSTGYRMAGFKVLWANEFIDSARDTYGANKAPYTVLDGRDIRKVTAQDILAATGLKVGELDLFDGSPPCASFSTAGKREAGWGTVKKYSDKAQRTDDLFFEYARLVRDLQPRTFVAENVSGLVKGTAKGYFMQILAELKSCGYRVEAQVLDAQWLGVPQARQRLIFVGVRNDLDMKPAFPKPFAYRYSVRDALPWILKQADNGGFGRGGMRDATVASPTIGASPSTGNGNFPPSLVEALTPMPGRVIHDTSGTWSTGEITDRPCPTITVGVNSVNSNHFKVEAESDMTKYATGREYDKLKPGESSEKYFSLVKPHPEKPCPTVTAHGGHPNTASVAHPVERRKFSIGELRRICAFPDDYVLAGTYAQQWERCGRSVPPLMMKAISAAVRDQVLIPLRSAGKIPARS